ncbi:YraN family protein [Chloroflexota bacterium]
MKRQDVGALGEKIARDFLKKKGYHIRETNFRCQYGEIDIITDRKGVLIFVEVRTKTTIDFGSPEESITYAKKEKLIASALTYINTHRNLPISWRIDFVAVELDQRCKASRIELFENAVN